MGLLSWWKGRRGSSPAPSPPLVPQSPVPKGGATSEASGTNGAVEVRRPPADVTVFEFGSAAESGAGVTLAGYCPVSDELEPCRWELVPVAGAGAPQFRIVF